MASRIQGITIEIGGDTSNLQKALKGVDRELKSTESNLRDINKLLKLNPGNVELLTQKQKNLEKAIGLTKTRLQELKNAQAGVEKGSAEWDNLQREIIATEADLKKLESGTRNFGSVSAQIIKAAGAAMQEAGKKVTELGNKMRGISTAAAGALTGLAGLGYKAVQNADDLNTLAKQTGISTEEIQKMKYASDLVDVSFEDISAAIRKMKPKMDESNETFKRLGVSVRDDVTGGLRSAEDVFYDTIAALSQIDNETERDQVAMELFGKSADSLAGIIDDGGAALKEYGEQAEELGVIMSQDTLDALNQTNDTIDKLKANIGGTLAKIGADVASILAPSLEKAADFISNLTEKLRSLSPEQQKMILTIAGIVAAIAPVLIIGGKIIGMVGTIISAVGTVVGVLGGPLTIAIAAIIAIGVLLYKHWDEIKAKAEEIWAKIVETFNKAKENVTTTLENLKNGTINVFENLKARVSAIWENIKYAITHPIETAWNTVSGIVDKIKNMFNFDLSFPKIKLPHFSWSWNDLGVIKIPNIDVQWYKKAYNQPYLFTTPTVVGNRGFGDGNGAEMVYGKDSLMRDIRDAMSAGDRQPIVITVQSVLDGKVIGQSVTQYQRSAARAAGGAYA